MKLKAIFINSLSITVDTTQENQLIYQVYFGLLFSSFQPGKIRSQWLWSCSESMFHDRDPVAEKYYSHFDQDTQEEKKKDYEFYYLQRYNFGDQSSTFC